MLEMPDLAQTSLDQIRRFLNTGEEEEEDNNITVMDEFMEWGYRHETIKALMMDFLIRQRHRVFGIEEENQLRPYLCADHEEQLETLVQLTSRISKS
ncbi:hypothetical protein BG004_007441 [Podila humilis]|nr:hypothetical protein BG004_007441 [Podila humilis]